MVRGQVHTWGRLAILLLHQLGTMHGDAWRRYQASAASAPKAPITIPSRRRVRCTRQKNEAASIDLRERHNVRDGFQVPRMIAACEHLRPDAFIDVGAHFGL